MLLKDSRFVVLALALLLASPVFAGGAEKMVVPPYQTLEVPGRSFSQEQVREAVIDAAKARRWVVVGDEPGKVTLRYAPRTHVAVISVSYDPQGFKIDYVSSENLDYKLKRDQPYIHENFNDWLARLAHDIRNSPVLWGVAGTTSAK